MADAQRALVEQQARADAQLAAATAEREALELRVRASMSAAEERALARGRQEAEAAALQRAQADAESATAHLAAVTAELATSQAARAALSECIASAEREAQQHEAQARMTRRRRRGVYHLCPNTPRPPFSPRRHGWSARRRLTSAPSSQQSGRTQRSSTRP